MSHGQEWCLVVRGIESKLWVLSRGYQIGSGGSSALWCSDPCTPPCHMSTTSSEGSCLLSALFIAPILMLWHMGRYCGLPIASNQHTYSYHILRKELPHSQLTTHLQECNVCNINSSQITIKKIMKLSVLITQGLSISSPAMHKYPFERLFHLYNKYCVFKLVFNQALWSYYFSPNMPNENICYS
jgi:hypothetical protein